MYDYKISYSNILEDQILFYKLITMITESVGWKLGSEMDKFYKDADWKDEKFVCIRLEKNWD